MRFAILVLTLVGCGYYHPITGAPQPGLIERAIASDVRTRSENQAVAREEARRVAFQKQLLVQAGALRTEATDAAKAGDCARVHSISLQIQTLPLTDFEGGYYATVFLANPAIASCVATHRECIERQRPECTPPPAVVQTRAECVALRDKQFDSSTEVGANRPWILASLQSCPAAPGDADAELVWDLTVRAILTAMRGECALAVGFDARIASLDPAHHATRWSRDPAVVHCQNEIAAFRADRERCLRDRKAAMREAQTITDAKQRGEALRAIPRCPEDK